MDYIPAENRTLGWIAAAWMTEHLVQPDGPNAGEPFELTREQLRILLRWYEINDIGRFRYRRGILRCRGEVAGDHPVLRWAYELSDLHERRLAAGHIGIVDRGEADEIDSQRCALVREIDRWVTTQLPPPLGDALVHTETVGVIVDRLAQFTAEAYVALASAADWELGDAWERLAELAVGYEDLASEVAAGRRRLPGGP